MTKKNVLKYHELIKLSQWILGRQNSLVEFKTTKKAVAENATQELGFPVSVHNIDGIIASLELKIDFQREPHVRKRDPRALRRIERLREAVILLYERCGEQIPTDINSENW